MASRHSREAANSVSRGVVEQSLSAAEAYFQADDLPRAEAILLRLLDRAPAEPAAHELHGQILLSRAAEARARGDVSLSREFAKRAYERYLAVIEHSPPSAGLHHSAGDVAQMAGLDDEALGHYLHAMELDPAQPRHAIFAAQLLSARQDYDAAEELLKRALAIDADEPLVHASLANISMQRKRFDEALAHIAEARAIQPQDAALRVIEATIHRRAGEPERGLNLLLGLPPSERVRPLVAGELAAGLAMLGDHAGAAEAWAQAFRARPDHPEAWKAALGAAEQFLEAGQRRESAHWLNQATILAPASHTEAMNESPLERISQLRQKLESTRGTGDRSPR